MCVILTLTLTQTTTDDTSFEHGDSEMKTQKKSRELQPHWNSADAVIADSGKTNTWVVWDSKTDEFVAPQNKRWTLAEFMTWLWERKPACLVMEHAHGVPWSPDSKAQTRFWATEADRDAFYAACVTHRIDLRFVPERDLSKYRNLIQIPKKSTDEDDVRSWREALNKQPHLWKSLKRPRNVAEFLDIDELFERNAVDRTMSRLHQRRAAGLLVKQAVSDDARDLQAAKTAYHHTIPSQIIQQEHVQDRLKQRLQTHTSDTNGPRPAGIVNGKKTFTYDGTPFTISLTDVMKIGTERKTDKTASVTQFAVCALSMLKPDGTRRVHPLTGKPYGRRFLKEQVLRFSPYHFHGGVARARIYHDGISNFILWVVKYPANLCAEGDSAYEVLGRLRTNPIDMVFLTELRNFARIAYEQVLCEFKAYLDEQDAAGKPYLVSDPTLFDEEETSELVLV